MVSSTFCLTIESSRKKLARSKDVRVKKILYPRPPRYVNCNHLNGFIMHRQALTSKEHTAYLAQPKKHQPVPFPCYTEKRILPCSTIVKDLAKPKALKVLLTFNHHLKHLSVFQIEKFLKIIFQGNCDTLDEMTQTIKNAIKERRNRINRQRLLERKINKKLNKKYAFNMTKNIVDSFQQFMRTTEKVLISEDLTNLSEVLLGQFCQIMRIKKPEKDSGELVDCILQNIADKTAMWMAEFAENCNFMDSDMPALENCGDYLSNTSHSIENLASHLSVKETGNLESEEFKTEQNYKSETNLGAESNIETGLSETDLEKQKHEIDETEIEKSIEKESKISFLRQSQVKFDAVMCQDLFSKIDQYQEAKAAKEAVKATKKATRELDKKIAKENKEFGRSGSLTECLENINQKPQWEIEWVDKTGN